jgi:predicted SprT family Zn-dependent metalloprotease
MNPFNSLAEVKALAISEIAKHFATYNVTTTYNFEWNTRKRAAGICSSRRKVIELSAELSSLNLNKPEFILNTIRHEIAHAICSEIYGPCHHNYTWQKVAISIGCNGKRCYDGDAVETPKGKYVYVCPNCGKELHMHKASRSKKACSDCCNKHNYGRFDERFVFVLKGSVSVVCERTLMSA